MKPDNWSKACSSGNLEAMSLCDCGKKSVQGSIYCGKCKRAIIRRNEKVMGKGYDKNVSHYKPFYIEAAEVSTDIKEVL